MVELLGPEGFPGPGLAVAGAGVATALEGMPVVDDVPVPDGFFEHPAAAIATIVVAATATTNPGLTTDVFVVIFPSLRLSTGRTESTL
jgi:hypothetical protein